EYIHIVDVDSAKTGQTVNHSIINDIDEKVNIPVQVGGGIRSRETVHHLLVNGVARVIIGTAAIQNPAFLKEAVSLYGDKIAVSLDARNRYIATDGWTDTSEVKAIE